MEIEKKFGKVSITEMVLYFVVGLLMLNGFSYLLFTLILKTPFSEIFTKIWIILIFVPLIQGIIHPLMNRDVILAIESRNAH